MAADGLNERDRVRANTTPPRGVLHARMRPGRDGYHLFWPGEDLAPFVDRFWTVRWELDEPQTAEVLPHPCVFLTFERGASIVTGVHRARFTRRLEGRGRVLGARFRPGGFRPLFGRAVAELTDREVGVVELFGERAAGLEDAVLAEEDDAEAFEVVQRFLRSLAPRPDPTVDLVAAIAARAAEDRSLLRAEQLAAAFDLGLRKLQRLFSEYVGVSPKWVLQRYRLHEAAERLATEPGLGGAELAHELGYADQAHFIRDFKRHVGCSPSDYAQRFR